MTQLPFFSGKRISWWSFIEFQPLHFFDCDWGFISINIFTSCFQVFKKLRNISMFIYALVDCQIWHIEYWTSYWQHVFAVNFYLADRYQWLIFHYCLMFLPFRLMCMIFNGVIWPYQISINAKSSNHTEKKESENFWKFIIGVMPI